MTVCASVRRHTSSDTSANTAIIAIAVNADTGSSAENSAPTSAVASTENSRNGARTLKFSRASTGRASGGSTPVRAASQPTNTARAMTANPVRIPITRADSGAVRRRGGSSSPSLLREPRRTIARRSMTGPKALPPPRPRPIRCTRGRETPHWEGEP